MGYYPEIMELDFVKEEVDHKYWLHRYLIAFYHLEIMVICSTIN